MKITRRGFGISAAAASILGAGAFGYRRMFGGWYLPTQYDDLLRQIVDREPAALLGKSMTPTDGAALAAKLRQPGFGLAARARDDAAAGRVVEVSGWVVPETVTFYAQLAAQF